MPFRALLGAILSVVKNVPVEPTGFNPNMSLDTIEEEEDTGPLSKHDIDDGSPYIGPSGDVMAYSPPITRSHHQATQMKAESGLMVCPCLLSPVICLAHLLLDHRVFPKFA